MNNIFNPIPISVQQIAEVSKINKVSTLVTDDTKYDKPTKILGCGSYKYYNHETGEDKYTNFKMFTLGNISAIKGASKSQKTFFTSLLVASFLNSNIENHNNHFYVNNFINKKVIIFDTEQHISDVAQVRKRINAMTKQNNPNLEMHALRELSYTERYEVIEDVMKVNKDAFVIIDGIADLVRDINDFGEGTEITQKLMKLSSETNSHILTIIHNNYGSGKPTGHLGSTLLKKCEIIINIEQENKTSPIRKISCEYVRGSRAFDDFYFKVDSYTALPKIILYQTQSIM